MKPTVPDPDGRWLAREVAWSAFLRELAAERGYDLDADELNPEFAALADLAESTL